MKKYFSLIFITVIAGYLLSGSFNIARAACNYSIQFNGNKTSATPADTIRFSAIVTRVGSASECENSVIIRLYVKSKSLLQGSPVGSEASVNFQPIAGLGSAASATLNFDVSSFNRSALVEPNVMEFIAKVFAPNGITQLTASSWWRVNITGAVGSTGVGMNVYFKDGATFREKSSFKANDPIQILVQANANDINKLDSGIQDIEIVFYVNGKALPGFIRTRAAVAQRTQYKDTLITEQNGFKNGTNTVEVKLFQADTSVLIGAGTGSVQATGLSGGTTPPGGGGGTGGKKDNNQTCALSSECKSNFCDYDSGKCEACASDGAECGEGYVCKQGVCTVQGKGDHKGGGGADDKGDEVIYNPLKYESLTDTLLSITKGFLAIVGLWAVTFIIIGGFKLVMSQGNEEAYLAAKKTITWAILGVVVAALSFSIVAIVQNLIGVNLQKRPGTENPIIKNIP